MKLRFTVLLILAAVVVGSLSVSAEPADATRITIGGPDKGFWYIPQGSDLSLDYRIRSFGDGPLDSGTGFGIGYRDELSWKIPGIKFPQTLRWGVGGSWTQYDECDESCFECWLEDEIEFQNFWNNNMKWTPSLTFGVGFSYQRIGGFTIAGSPERTEEVVEDTWCSVHGTFDDCFGTTISYKIIPAVADMEYKSESLLGLRLSTGISIAHNNSPYSGFLDYGLSLYPSKAYEDEVESSSLFRIGTRIRF